MCNAPNSVNWDVAGAMELFCKLVLVALLKQKTEPHTKNGSNSQESTQTQC